MTLRDALKRDPITWSTRLTILGLLVGLIGAVLHSIALVSISLVVDTLDGRLARHTKTETQLGALVDWWSDVVIGYALVVSVIASSPIHATVGLGVMLTMQLAGAYTGRRLTGRSVVTLITIHAWMCL